ncbi:MAG: hypothetical protein Q8L41_02955 [Anaerolineales bacterium]|nr:hypothetical protein [Anaerolineales bacterium]
MSETSEVIRQRVQAARERQRVRFSQNGLSDIVSNADMCIGEIRRFCQLQDEGQSLMRAAMSQLNLFARAYHRILKLARTIADLAGNDEVQLAHLAEALHLRSPKNHDGVDELGSLLDANDIKVFCVKMRTVSFLHQC